MPGDRDLYAVSPVQATAQAFGGIKGEPLGDPLGTSV